MMHRKMPVLFVWLAIGPWAAAQDQPTIKPAASNKQLADDQDLLARRYREFEIVLQRMADLLRQQDPDRAALLERAFQQSKQELVTVQLNDLAKLLGSGKFRDAIKGQQDVQEDMAKLLEMLLTYDLAKELREKRERTERYLREVKELREQQQNLRAKTERAGKPQDASQLSPEQGKLADQTGKLADDIKKDEQTDKDKKAGDAQSKEGKSDAQTKDANSQQGQEGSKGQEGQQGQKGQQGQQGEQGQQNQQGQQGQQGQKNDQPKNPAQDRVQNAKQAMQQAKEKLEQLKQQEASAEQDQAIRELEKAIEELEEILRQLREEERAQALKDLERRFRKMLAMQREVFDGTVRLDQIDPARRSRADEEKARALSRKEAELIEEADQALLVLREDGTALAFPEAVEQIREDVLLCVSLLAKAAVDSFTQSVEQDIIKNLEEMIASLQKEMQKNKKDQQQQEGGNQQGKSPLVDKLAEIKMVRSMQQRVLERTARLQQATTAPVEERDRALSELADRQSRVYQITRDISQGKAQ